jgi:hypothetical protein
MIVSQNSMLSSTIEEEMEDKVGEQKNIEMKNTSLEISALPLLFFHSRLQHCGQHRYL